MAERNDDPAVSWWSAIRSGDPVKVQDLLSRRGASANVATATNLTDYYDPNDTHAAQTLPGGFPRILRSRKKTLKALDHRFGFGEHRLKKGNQSYQNKTPPVSEYFWLPDGIDTKKPRTGETATHVCAGRGFAESLILLIQENCNLMQRNSSGSTPLHAAARNGHAHIVQIVVNALQEQEEEQGYDAYENQESYEHPARRAVAAQNSAGDSPLATAARNGHAETLELLCEIGGESVVQQRNNMGETPLELATRCGFDQCVEILLNNGAFANGYAIRRTLNGHEVPNADPLLWACRGTNPRVVALLRQAGANVNPSHLFESVRKHSKAPNLRDQLLPQLMKSQSQSLERDRNRNSKGEGEQEEEEEEEEENNEDHKEQEEIRHAMKKAIAVAIQSNREDLAFALVNQVAAKKDTRLAKTLIDNTSGSTPLLLLSASHGHSSVVQSLLEMGADVNYCDPSSGNTAMHASINDVCAELLVTHGANVNVLNKEQCSPLHIGSRRGDYNTVELLVNNGAAINVRNNDGCTPLVEAVRCAPMMHPQRDQASADAIQEHIKIVNLLTSVDRFTRTPFDNLKKTIVSKDNTIAQLEEKIIELQNQAEQDMLDAAKERAELKKSSAAVLHCFEKIMASKSMAKNDVVIDVLKNYQALMDEEWTKLKSEKDKNSTGSSRRTKEANNEDDAESVAWPGIEEFSMESVYVPDEIASKKANQRPKKKSKKVYRKEQLELFRKRMLEACSRLHALIDTCPTEVV